MPHPLLDQDEAQPAEALDQEPGQSLDATSSTELDELAQLAPRPHTLAETGVPPRVLEMLLLKHLSHVTDLDNVITSYSIHYTKLYELVRSIDPTMSEWGNPPDLSGIAT